MAIKRTRKRTHRPTTRRLKSERRLFFDGKRRIADAAVRSRWDNRKSPVANLTSLEIGIFQDRLADDAELQRPSEPKRSELESVA